MGIANTLAWNIVSCNFCKAIIWFNGQSLQLWHNILDMLTPRSCVITPCLHNHTVLELKYWYCYMCWIYFAYLPWNYNTSNQGCYIGIETKPSCRGLKNTKGKKSFLHFLYLLHTNQIHWNGNRTVHAHASYRFHIHQDRSFQVNCIWFSYSYGSPVKTSLMIPAYLATQSWMSHL